LRKNTNTELGNSHDTQLYDLSEDIKQIKNVAREHVAIVRRMTARLNEITEGNRTRPTQEPIGIASPHR
jgi:hypothetical protein